MSEIEGRVARLKFWRLCVCSFSPCGLFEHWNVAAYFSVRLIQLLLNGACRLGLGRSLPGSAGLRCHDPADEVTAQISPACLHARQFNRLEVHECRKTESISFPFEINARFASVIAKVGVHRYRSNYSRIRELAKGKNCCCVIFQTRASHN